MALQQSQLSARDSELLERSVEESLAVDMLHDRHATTSTIPRIEGIIASTCLPSLPSLRHSGLMGEVLIVTAPPGAGKSTVAEIVADAIRPSALVRGDDFFAFLRRGFVAPWLPAAHAQNTAVTAAAAAATGRLAGHCDVVYDGVVGPWFLPSFRAALGMDRLHDAVLLLPLELCLERVRTRNAHGFRDPDAADHMWHAFDEADLDARHLVAAVEPPAALADRLLRLWRADALLLG